MSTIYFDTIPVMIYKPNKPYNSDLNDLVEANDFITKGRALPIGTVRNWSGTSYVKEADGWKPVAHAKDEKRVEDIKPKENAQPAKPGDAGSPSQKDTPSTKSKQLDGGKLSISYEGSTADMWYIHDDKGEKIGSIEITKKDGKASLTSIRLGKDSRGKGLGRQTLKHLVSHYGTVTSDHKGEGFTSDDAKKMWEALGSKKGSGPGKALYSLSKDQMKDEAPKKESKGTPSKEVTDEEKAALKEYQSGMYNSAIGGYANIQAYLRTGKPKFGTFDAKEKAIADEVAKQVSSAIKKHPLEKPMTVYRGMKITKDDEGSKMYGDLKPGDTFQDKGFTSTSTNKKVGDKFAEKLNRSDVQVVIEVSLKEGDPALPMDLYHKHESEKEILLDRNTKFKVVSVSERSGIKKIKLEIA